MIRNIQTTLAAIAVIGFVGLCIWGIWNAKRHFNYKWAYQSQVQSEIAKAMSNHVNQYHNK